MRGSRKNGRISTIFGMLLVLTLLFTTYGPSTSSSSASSNINHVILIMMENQNYQNIIGSSNAPYINSLANNYALATNYYGIEYPSLPNYIEITSGSNGGITSDCSSGPSPGGCETSNSNIFTLLQSNGLTWKAYEESMPSNCYTSDSGNLGSGGYIVHHDPIVYYTDLSSVCSQNDIPMGSLSSKTGPFYAALDNNSLPNFSFITPNSCDDMHSCGISAGDSWLSEIIPYIINSPSFSSTIVIIAWDTGNCANPCNENKNGGGQVVTIMVGPSNIVSNGEYGSFYNHYSTLATIENIFGLGNLGRSDASATPLTAMLASGSVTSTTTTLTTTTSINSSTSATITNTSSSSPTISTSDTSSTIETNTSTIATTIATTTSTDSSGSSSTTSVIASTNSSTGTSSQISSTSNQGPRANQDSGLISSYAPSKNPPAAYGVGIYEVPLFGALGYVLINFRKGHKDWPLQTRRPTRGSRDLSKPSHENYNPARKANGRAGNTLAIIRRSFSRLRIL